MHDLLRAFHDAVTGATPLASAQPLVRGRGLHVYAHAYVARIAGVLARDYPKLHAVLGAGAFDALVAPYLRAYPTRHPSLREAGAQLAAFVGEPHAGLARLERARVEVFDGPDATALARDDLAALVPEDWAALRLQLVPASALVELTDHADEVWDAIEDGRSPPDAPAGATTRTVLVWRRDLDVIHRTLEPDEALALRRIATGTSFGDVCETLDVERALELLVRWLDAAILCRLEPADRGNATAVG